MRAEFAVVIVILCLFSPFELRGQTVRVESIPQDDGSSVIDFTLDWDGTLAAFVDSVGVLEWSYGDIERAAAGNHQLSYSARLPTFSLPQVSILAREFDEMDVAVSASMSDIEQQAYHPDQDVWAAGLGLIRKQPVASIFVPVYQLDATTQQIRRFRRIRVLVSPTAPANAREVSSAFSAKKAQVTESKLSTGQVFRVSIKEKGIYRITRSLLTTMGLNPDAIDPNAVHVLSNGGRPLPALNGIERIADLAEQPIVRTGGGDGQFGASDEVLFYAPGPTGWIYKDGQFEHYTHPYSNDNAVFIKIETASGPTLVDAPFSSTASFPSFSSTPGRFFLDIEERVWSREHGSGTDWMSNTIRNGGSRNFLTNQILPGLMAGPITYQARVAIASNPMATVAMVSGSDILAQFTAPYATTQRSEDPAAITSTFSFQQTVAASQPIQLTMRLLSQNNEPEASLDWVRITYDQDLTKPTTGPLYFTTRPGQFGDQQYQIKGYATEPRIWDVTGGILHRQFGVGSVSGQHAIQVGAQQVQGGPRDLVVFLPADTLPLSAAAVTPISNQNLHGLVDFPELVIVAPVAFLSAAEKLASHRRNQGMIVNLVTQTQVFNEFSGGVPDMRAVRDYMKFLYDRAPSNQEPKYLLLFGDGHYDFRGISGYQQPLTNHIFPYETFDSAYTDGTFTSDDYFGLLDDNEGLWVYSGFTDTSSERVDIGIGRFPAQTLSEANMMVDKVISYEDPSTFGSWRTSYTAVADDGPTGLSGTTNDRDLHLSNVDQVVELVARDLYPQINLQKIYAETYERVFLNGFRIPEAKREISAAINRGTLVVNYSGHGGPNGLAQEEIFTKEDALALTNRNRLSIFVTATCSFGWWDLEEFQSGAESLLLNPNGGAVALFTTVRLVYTSGGTETLNAGLNRALNIAMFKVDEEGLPRRLGDILAETKNTGVGLQGNSRKFNLLGDPSMRIGLPPGHAVVESLNQVPLNTQMGQMKALDLVTIEGEVQSANGMTNAAFNGAVNVTVYDAERNVPLVEPFYNPTSFFRQREDLLWRGEVQAVSGKYKAQFVVPKDISYSNSPGRISVYSQDNAFHALGYSENFIVGGTSDTPPNDNQGPEIRLFMNDSTFVSGGQVEADSDLLVLLYDQSGINTVGTGVGHELLLTLDGDDTSSQDIGSGFEANPNSFQRGSVTWPLKGLETGPHTLRVRAWDVLNNSNSAELSFIVANDEVLSVHNVYNYPNPMNRETRFVFEHNQPSGTSAEVQLRIYTLSGRPIRTIHSDEALPSGVLSSGPLMVYWDGKDDDLDRPATGIYLYRLRVVTYNSNGERQVSEHTEKLAIIK